MRNARWLTRHAVFAAVLVLITLLQIGCTRGIRQAKLDPLELLPVDSNIRGDVALCLPSKLHGRTWNVRDYPFQLDLGKPTAKNLELITKQIFRRVDVRFVEDCERNATLPWLTATIVSANRETPGEASGDLHYTSVRLLTTLHQPDGATLWSFETVAVAGLPRLTLKERWVREIRINHAARSFGDALELALRRTREDLISSDEVRRYFETHHARPPGAISR